MIVCVHEGKLNVVCSAVSQTRLRIIYTLYVPYSFIVWLKVGGGLLTDQASPNQTDMFNYLHHEGRTLMDQILLHMVFQTMVFYLLRENNIRRHEGSWIPHEQTSRLITKAVKNKIFFLRYRFPHKLAGLLHKWFEVT